MDDEPDTPAAADTPVVHRLVFAGKCLPGFDEAAVRDALARHLQRASGELFSGKRVMVSDELGAVEIEIAKQALEALGARVQIEVVEAPAPMPPLGFLDLAVPAPLVEPVAKENLSMTDSGWQALNSALEPTPDEALPEDLLNMAAARNRVALGEGGAASDAAASPISPALTAPAPLSRPPTDLSAVFGNAPSPVSEPSPAFAPVMKNPLPLVRQTEPPATGEAIAAPAVGMSEPSSLIACPICRDLQPPRLFCRACGADIKLALAAQQEERAQRRGSHRGSPALPPAAGKSTPVADDGPRLLGFRVPDHVADRLTLANGLLATFAVLLALAAVGFVWSKIRPDPVLSSPKPALSNSTTAGNADPTGTAKTAPPGGMGPPPSETDVLARLKASAASAAFRQNYWPKATNKAFVVSDETTWAWRAEMPSVTRALAEALGDCESRRPEGAPECKVVNINNFWQE